MHVQHCLPTLVDGFENWVKQITLEWLPCEWETHHDDDDVVVYLLQHLEEDKTKKTLNYKTFETTTTE